MSLLDYRASQHPALMQAPFYALVMAAMRGADSFNIVKLREAWPEVWDEMCARKYTIDDDGVWLVFGKQRVNLRFHPTVADVLDAAGSLRLDAPEAAA